MIPDTAFVEFSCWPECLGYRICDEPVRGRAYALDNAPQLDVVTWLTPEGAEIEMAGPYGTDMEDAMHDALWKEARSAHTLSRLHEAFVEFHAEPVRPQLVNG